MIPQGVLIIVEQRENVLNLTYILSFFAKKKIVFLIIVMVILMIIQAESLLFYFKKCFFFYYNNYDKLKNYQKNKKIAITY